ncbi:MAG TPA: PRC-barrel domain-containing protein [Verrucomicrobiae bacterium]|jgi:uncharacterized protein YrrD|nr:PRC-barrel domain-containing protein [Verrucomicrobiae bacterium]
MMRSLKELEGHKLGAADGHIGHIKDFYFDDALWVVRYLVADTGTWITGRLVLLSPLALHGFDEKEKVLNVRLTRRQIERSPSIEAHKPVSRQYEEEYYNYYNWPFYWQGGSLWGLSDFPTVPPLPIERAPAPAPQTSEDAHLNSANSVFGYKAQAVDKEVGTVADILVDDRSWTIAGIVIDSGHWLPGRKIIVSPAQISAISWTESTVTLKSTSDVLERAPAYEAAA